MFALADDIRIVANSMIVAIEEDFPVEILKEVQMERSISWCPSEFSFAA